MQLADLRDGTVQQTSVVDVSPRTASRSVNYYGARTKLIESDETVVMLQGTKVLFIELPEIASDLTTPPHFKSGMPQEIEVGEKVKLKLPVSGKLDGVSFNQLQENPNIELDSAAGELTIDTKELWDSFIERQVPDGSTRVLQNDPNWRLRSRSPQPEDRMNAVINARTYKSLTGKDLAADKLATQLPIEVSLVEPCLLYTSPSPRD